ncbi:MAG: UMP kinase [Deltaproteobacteria bacterium]|nr:UMP kinase [Deltaproteobacteria bacterium]
MNRAVYKRILLKLSGEALMGQCGYGIDAGIVGVIAREIRDLLVFGVQLGIVVGGGNICRGIQASAAGLNRIAADYMGMLATVINGLALQSALEDHGVETRVQTSIEMQGIAEPYIRRKAIDHLEKGRVVIFAGGTGNPFFTTDTAAALRAVEIRAEILMKATTKVDGVYDKDPIRDAGARFFERISYTEVLAAGLQVMDAAAISLCRDHGLPVVVFKLKLPGGIRDAICGQSVGTYIGG